MSSSMQQIYSSLKVQYIKSCFVMIKKNHIQKLLSNQRILPER